MPGYELKLLDETGQAVAAGDVGDLWVADDSAAPFYWHKHEKSKRAMRGEWVFTGDRYRIDEAGFYWYAGRGDDMLKVGGLWVSPVEVEAALVAHDVELRRSHL